MEKIPSLNKPKHFQAYAILFITLKSVKFHMAENELNSNKPFWNLLNIRMHSLAGLLGRRLWCLCRSALLKDRLLIIFQFLSGQMMANISKICKLITGARNDLDCIFTIYQTHFVCTQTLLSYKSPKTAQKSPAV